MATLRCGKKRQQRAARGHRNEKQQHTHAHTHIHTRGFRYVERRKSILLNYLKRFKGWHERARCTIFAYGRRWWWYNNEQCYALRNLAALTDKTLLRPRRKRRVGNNVSVCGGRSRVCTAWRREQKWNGRGVCRFVVRTAYVDRRIVEGTPMLRWSVCGPVTNHKDLEWWNVSRNWLATFSFRLIISGNVTARHPLQSQSVRLDGLKSL